MWESHGTYKCGTLPGEQRIIYSLGSYPRDCLPRAKLSDILDTRKLAGG